MTLLEVMVALVILGLVVASYLELFGGALRGANAAQTWSHAVAYAADGMERGKLEPNPDALANTVDQLPGGFARHYEIRPWAAHGVDVAFAELRVIVTIPGGGQYTLARLVRAP